MRKYMPLMVLVSSAACGDTNNYYVTGDSNTSGAGSITTCEQAMEKDYQCNPQKYNDYMAQWGTSIEEQKNSFVNHCMKGNWVTIPEFMICMNQSCEYINSGACGNILDDAGF